MILGFQQACVGQLIEMERRHRTVHVECRGGFVAAHRRRLGGHVQVEAPAQRFSQGCQGGHLGLAIGHDHILKQIHVDLIHAPLLKSI